MEEFLDLTVLGLCTASIYTLAASGLVLTYTTTGIFNFAQGAIGMLGAFAFWELHRDRDGPSRSRWPSCCWCWHRSSVLVIERLIMRHLTDAPRRSGSSSPSACSSRCSALGCGPGRRTKLIRPCSCSAATCSSIFGVGVSWHHASAVVIAVVVGMALRTLLYRTRSGLDMRAAVDSRPLALLHGARPDRSAALAWAIGCSLAALAGILIAPVATMNHIALTVVIVSAYAAAVFGRLRSSP